MTRFQIRDSIRRDYLYGVIEVASTATKGGLQEVLEKGVFITEEAVQAINLAGLEAVIEILRGQGVRCRDVTQHLSGQPNSAQAAGLPALFV